MVGVTMPMWPLGDMITHSAHFADTLDHLNTTDAEQIENNGDNQSHYQSLKT